MHIAANASTSLLRITYVALKEVINNLIIHLRQFFKIFKVVMPFITRFIRVFLCKWLLSHDITSVGALQSLKMQLSENCNRIYAFGKKSKKKIITDSSFLTGKSKKYWTEKSSAYANSSNNTRDFER